MNGNRFELTFVITSIVVRTEAIKNEDNRKSGMKTRLVREK